MICPFCYHADLIDDGQLHIVMCPECGELDRKEVETKHFEDARDDATDAAIMDALGK